jgi:hypothetical protein
VRLFRLGLSVPVALDACTNTHGKSTERQREEERSITTCGGTSIPVPEQRTTTSAVARGPTLHVGATASASAARRLRTAAHSAAPRGAYTGPAIEQHNRKRSCCRQRHRRLLLPTHLRVNVRAARRSDTNTNAKAQQAHELSAVCTVLPHVRSAACALVARPPLTLMVSVVRRGFR